MPYDYFQQPRHLIIPSEQSGYELAPVAGSGLWSIVTPLGTVINLNTLGLQVLAYTGAGMPPIENITTPLGVLGGSVLQRTVTRPRTITLSCIAQGATLREVQRIKNSIIAQVAPYNSLQAARSIKLHYQLVNYCGDAIGTALEVAVTYAGDLTGSNNNLYQDRFDLSFMEWAPPGIKESTVIQPSLSYSVLNASTEALRRRLSTGEWLYQSFSIGRSLMYDANGELWRGSATVVTSQTGITSQVTNGNVNTLAYDQNNDIYAGGAFTSPYNYIMKYSGGAWADFLPSGETTQINGTVRALAFDNTGQLYIGGQFTAPQTNLIVANASQTSWVNIGAAIGGVGIWAICRGLDGLIYIAGDFTAINSVTSHQVIAYDPVANTYIGISPTGFGGTYGPTTGYAAVFTLAALPNGGIVAGGAFTTAQGITANNVALWNGTQWQALGNGLDAQVNKVAVNQSTGDIYATGFFTKSGSVPLTPGFAKWNGSSWMPGDIDNSIALTSTNCLNALALRQSDGQIAITSDDQNIDLYNGGFNTVTYTGTADVYPQVKFTGPGKLWGITNYTTGKGLYFNNYTLLAGETATFTHDPAGGVTFISSFYGNVLGKILPGSDFTTFGLIPGTNNIVPFIESYTGATKVELIYQNTHFSFEAGSGIGVVAS